MNRASAFSVIQNCFATFATRPMEYMSIPMVDIRTLQCMATSQILVLSGSTQHLWQVTMDSDVENALLLHRKDGSIMKFSEMSSGLYYYEATRKRSGNSNESVTNYTFLNTVFKERIMPENLCKKCQRTHAKNWSTVPIYFRDSPIPKSNYQLPSDCCRCQTCCLHIRPRARIHQRQTFS